MSSLLPCSASRRGHDLSFESWEHEAPENDHAWMLAGLYTFTFKDGSKVPARFSYVFVRRNGKWLIADHHSSLMPERASEGTTETSTNNAKSG